MRLINGDHLEERVRKIVKDYAQAAKDVNVVPGRVIFSSCGVIGLVQSEPIEDAIPIEWILEQAKKQDKVVASILMLTVQEWKDETD